MINYINIKNFKGFTECKIKLNKASLLLGTNSGGKSSVIQSILLANLSTADKNSIDLINNKFKLNLYSFDEIINCDSEDSFFEVTLEYDDNSHVNLSYEPTDDTNVVVYNRRGVLKSHEITYLSADRLISSYQKTGNINDICLGQNNEYIGYIIDKGRKRIIDVDKNKNNLNSKETNFLDIQINEWLNFILPNSKVSAKSNNLDNYISLLFGENMNLHQTNIGYGVSFILPIIIAGLVAKPDTILIVENPELHLHPSAQSRMSEFLAIVASSGVQVVIETHSEHIVNGFRKSILNKKHPLKNEEITINYFDKNTKCEVEEIILNEMAEIKLWPRGFMDQEELDLFEMRKMRLNK